MATQWSEAQAKAVFEAFTTEGLSASRIAGRYPGVSRNAIIGVVHRYAARHGLSSAKPGGSRQTPSVKRRPPARPKPARFRCGTAVRGKAMTGGDLSAAAAQCVNPLFKSLADLGPRECHFPVTPDKVHPADHRFCGRPAEPGRPYCPHHADRATRA